MLSLLYEDQFYSQAKFGIFTCKSFITHFHMNILCTWTRFETDWGERQLGNRLLFKSWALVGGNQLHCLFFAVCGTDRGSPWDSRAGLLDDRYTVKASLHVPKQFCLLAPLVGGMCFSVLYFLFKLNKRMQDKEMSQVITHTAPLECTRQELSFEWSLLWVSS